MTDDKQQPEDVTKDEEPPKGEQSSTEEPATDAPEADAPAPEAEAPAPGAADDEPAGEPEAATAAEVPEPETAADAPEPETAADAPEPDAAADEPEPDAAADGPDAAADGPDAAADGPDAAADAPDEPASDAQPAAGAEQAATDADAEKAPKPRAKRARKQAAEDKPDAIPGAHLEPDLVLEDSPGDRGGGNGAANAEIEAAEQALDEEGGTPTTAAEPAEAAPTPVPAAVLELAADARYVATGKRKRAVARVILKPGTGVYTVNGREMNAFFPRPTLQTIVRQPLQTVGHEQRMDVVAKIHGGGVSSQAGALRHGISRALTEADPNLRGELKSRGFLTRDPRVKERKKAGLKKARKRPQFSKR
ncbi:MAG: 30S ribosomal protein S9 [Thermoleophilaceae bacterium]